MRKRIAIVPLLLLAFSLSSIAKTPTAIPVQVKHISDGWVLLRDGQPYYINGVVGICPNSGPNLY